MYTINPAIYAKNMFAVHCESDGEYKSFEQLAAEQAQGMNKRYSHREHAYILSAHQVKKFEQLIRNKKMKLSELDRTIKESKLPAPFKQDSRSCFGLLYFKSFEDAVKWHNFIRQRGDRYNGGFMDGAMCGREEEFDCMENGERLYAVSCQ